MSTHPKKPRTQRRSSQPPPLGPHARRVIPVLGLISALRAVGLVGFAAAVGSLLAALAKAAFDAISRGHGSEASSGWADFVGSKSAGVDGLFPHWLLGGDGGAWSWGVVAVGLSSLALRAAADWGLSVVSQRAATETKSTIRRGLLERVLSAPRGSSPDGETTGDGAVAILVSRGLDALDDYYVKTITALVSTGVIPAILLVVILCADPLSALVLVLTLPLVPIFMILIGKTTQNDTREAQSQLLRLSQHIVELSRGLPVLFGLKREKAQAQALSELGEQYRRRTMTTLRSAFQSSLALELITTISVALVAVFIGLRLVHGEIGLDTALLVLLLAPECFQPLRDVGTAFHQSQDGVEALRRSEELLDEPVGRSVVTKHGFGSVSVDGLTVGYPGRGQVLRDISFTLAAGTTTLLTGPSGSGKTTLLKVLGDLVRAERVGPDSKGPTMSGSISTPGAVAWIGQSPHFLAATAADEVGLYIDPEDAEIWLQDFEAERGPGQSPKAEKLRSKWSPVICSALRSVGLEELEAIAPTALSAGQARRLAIARVLAASRVRLSDCSDSGNSKTGQLILVDEPTAHLDAEAADKVTGALQELSEGGATILWVTHDVSTGPSGAGRIVLDRNGRITRRELSSTSDESLLSRVRSGGEPATLRVLTRRPDPEKSIVDGGAEREDVKAHGIRETLATVRRATGVRWRQALGSVGLSFLTVAFGASLTALSGWLIVRASQQPGMMYLMVAIVGVRFFGLGRAVFRYLERLLTHDTVLRAANRLRMNAWNSMGESALSLRSLLRGGTFLDRLVGDVDELRDAMPRVLLPIATIVPTMIAAVVATVWTVPSAAWLVAVAAFVTSVIIPRIVLVADRHADTVSRASSERTLRGALGAMESSEDLRGNRLSDAVLSALTRQDRIALRASRRSAFATGLGNGLTLATWWATALGIAVLAWGPVTDGEISAPMAAIPVLLCTALVEPSTQAIEAIRSWPTFSRLVAKIRRGLDTTPRGSANTAKEGEEAESSETSLMGAKALTLDNLSARWPGMDRPAVNGLSGQVSRGSTLGITGPSGSGKTTTLAILLGFLTPESGEIRVDSEQVTSRRLRGASAWCPQDAYIFDSTVRGNLSLARPRTAAPSDEELESIMRRVGLGPLLDSWEFGLETRVGAGGSMLSGGQRQRLAMARALLTEAPFLLVDEPTAHLDEEAALSLIEELDRATRTSASGTNAPGTIVISHRPTDLVHCRSVISLEGCSGR
ncbi:thiol reductant ABC exporter subunit CydC [Rothia uropygialis]|uniref:thiol reductant ABC exporter subunit CydC n=1 Tax=Kocuria sp. 36 TaxID=1415402 RepID=UPI00101B6044|nr:thiol reductant ABC exporter subunit CydC [Kocuria sp. 36]